MCQKDRKINCQNLNNRLLQSRSIHTFATFNTNMNLYNNMKRILSFMVILAALHLKAQEVDRTHAPKPGPAPVINIPDAAEFTLPNGLKVFVVRNTKLPI